MANVASAVAEFDEAVRAPWRPPLRSAAHGPRAALHLVPDAAAPRVAGDGGADPRGVRSRPSGRALGARAHGGRPGGRPAGGRVGGPPAPRPVRGGCIDRSPAPAARLRLTPRARRLGVVLAVAVGVAVGAWVDGATSGGDGERLRLVGESSVVVRSGDTLWSIAGAVAGDEDVRAVVDEIQQLNGLHGALLVPGQTLQLP